MSDDIRALDALIHTHTPLLRKRQPYWAPKPPTCHGDIRIPAWTWERDGLGDIPDRVTLDANGAFLAPLSGTEFAHGALERTGEDPGDPFKPAPGYYRIPAYRWADPRIVSPLGLQPLPPPKRPGQIPLVWVAAPTLKLLAELTEQGSWPGVEVVDSWTCPDRVRFATWAAWVRDERAAALLADDRERYDAVKLAYAQAIQMLLGTEDASEAKSKVRRPDWYHTVRAQHSANQWRKAWACTMAGVPVLAMGNVDELTFAASDFVHLLNLAAQEKPPIRIDQSGLKLGAFKIKDVTEDGSE